VEKTFKSGEKVDEADVEERKLRMLYTEADGAIFMDDVSFEQLTVPNDVLGSSAQWLLEDLLYSIIFYKGNPIEVVAPTFMEMTIVETSTGLRGDTSGRVLKPAKLQTGATVQVPIFINEGEKIKIDTRTGEYVSRV
jgi:elongation factor P